MRNLHASISQLHHTTTMLSFLATESAFGELSKRDASLFTTDRLLSFVQVYFHSSVLQVSDVVQVVLALEVANVFISRIHMLLVLVVDPVADLSLAVASDDQTTRTVLLMVGEHTLKDITVREDVATISVHLMVLDLALVDDTVGNDVATNAVDLTILNLSTEVRIFGIVAKLELKVDVWILRIFNDVNQLEGANFVPLLARLNACFIGLAFEE